MKTFPVRHFPTIAIIAMATLSACNSSGLEKQLEGNWTGVSWLSNGQPAAYDVSSAGFSFDTKGRYAYRYAETTEQGDWYLSGRELFTTPDGGTRMMVRIARLEGDTLVFDMNRGGTPERLTLVRSR